MDQPPDNHHRRITDDPLLPVARRISLENRMDALEEKLDKNTEKLDKNTEMTETIVKLFGTMEAGVKFLGWIGAALKWTVTIAGACAALWAMANGKVPK